MSKLVKTTITSMAILLIVAIAALVIVLNVAGDSDEGKAKSIDDIVEYAYETPEITTDLEDGSFVRIQFQILTDGKDAKEEISKRDFQLKNILIKELATMNEEKFKTGLTDLEAEVKTKLNAVMTEGKITNVYTVSKILQ
ncbi:flagellar basal body-associated protein FliL [Virgibacillus sp. SK37]|uniref:flagellar basal body-associated protein FliL n=1 Tax=Virgibacillus sp. SK37 TaxID=403957 RepID=UPI0004D152DD|nr:flagellar basal body-associated protein FliL [Virgibacillus sp. SK37]AIF43753.1 flagellar basal body protein FliL [Virgibacillus sp. SK37]